MKRRQFVRGATLSAVAISTTGFIHLEGTTYVGDCQTTTDILGPFYRPNAPIRDNLVIEGTKGEEVVLKGRIIHDDCLSAIQGAKVELWHCSAEEVYDNESEAFNYRGITFADALGDYHFRTQLPVPYDAGGGMYRPAHFHLMISAPGYQNLVTQLYFSGDPYLAKDRSSNAPNAKSRILDLEEDADGTITIPFNVVLQKELPLDPATIDRLVGVYIDEKDPDEAMEFFKHENQLWIKNEVFGEHFRYIGENTFEVPSTGGWGSSQVQFEILKDGAIKATATDSSGSGKKTIKTALKKV